MAAQARALRASAASKRPLAGYSIDSLCRAMRLPVPVGEHRFHPTRRWRFDWAWTEQKVALEIDGGIWVQGRHTRGSGRARDMTKFSEAAIFGWRILYCTPDQVADGSVMGMLKRALG